jgi:hypothetical protein
MTGTKRSENKIKTDKRKAPRSAWKAGQSGNPGGRPKNAVSLTAIARDYLALEPKAIGQQLTRLASRYNQLGQGATMAQYIMGSFLLALANDPQPGNMRELWRRIDGEVASLNIDVSTLTDYQLERLANGEDVYSVLANRGDGGTREAEKDSAEE